MELRLPENLYQKARVLELSGDETRIRILCALFSSEKLCVTELSEALSMSVAAVSHHLQVLEGSGILVSERQGKRIEYEVSGNPYMKYIKQLICHKEKRHGKQA